MLHFLAATQPSVGQGYHLSICPNFRGRLSFHRRYIVSRKVCRFWANMVRQLDIEQIVPQHGARFVGRQAVQDFISWVEGLECGVDLMTQNAYQVPN